MRQSKFFLVFLTTTLLLVIPGVVNGQSVLVTHGFHAEKQAAIKPNDSQAAPEKPPGMISCTSEVPAATCKIVSHELASIQSFLSVHGVQFVVADEQAFEQEKRGSADLVIAKYVPNATPMIHSSFDDQIIFQVTKESAIHCPDRVIVSVDLFRPRKTLHSDGNKLVSQFSEGIDTDAVNDYGMFLLGYIEGCRGRK